MSTQNQTYILAKNVFYTNPGHPLCNCMIRPGLKKQELEATYPHLTPQQSAEVRKQFTKDGSLLLTFPHLDDKNREKLVAKGTIVAYHEAK
ncbi:MAG: hypothetical protein KC441_01520 [Anaerolineales bacterium]|nr:hypothetical protein [Anaerolineales bacterium]